MVKIREFREDDEEWIRREWKESQLEYFGRISQEVLNDAIEYTEKVLQNDLLHISQKWKSPSVFLVAEEDGNPLGTIAVRIKEDDHKTAEIQRLFTLVSARGKGVASKLVDYCESWIRESNCTKIVIETTALQVQAANMYLRRGYQVTHVGK